MSAFEDYDRTSVAYAQLRRPVGTEIVLGILLRHLRRLDECSLIDVGCGPGIYAFALSEYVGRVTGVDASQGQIAQADARKRLEPRDNLQFRVGDAMALDVADASFDAGLVSLVFHHLEREPQELVGHDKVLDELARVVRPGGVVVIGASSKQQSRNFWYSTLIPRAAEIMAARHVALDTLVEMAGEAGLTAAGAFVPVDASLLGPSYFDGLGPLRAEWRESDSIFALLTAAELEQLQSDIERMHSRGELDDFIRTRDEVRKSIGQVTFMAFLNDGGAGH